MVDGFYRNPSVGPAQPKVHTTLVFLFLVFAMMMMLSLELSTFIWINYFKVCHHSGFMVLDYVAVIHPHSRPVVWHPCDFHLAPGFQINRVFPG